MDGKSLKPQDDKLQKLKQILPEAFTEGKIDWEKLKATLGEDVNFSNERYVLNWAGKSESFKILQTPTTQTLKALKDRSINFEKTDNIFIEGENLQVLKVLQKSYFGKIKMIYIDPPYNTGSDAFIYPDKFSETKDEYQKRIGEKDDEGYMTKEGMFHKNSKENGQYHSNWLNMMYPRLFLAKNLLKQDGVIFVSIDDNEIHNLRLLMNEVFGEENYLQEIIWKRHGGGGNDSKYFAVDHEYVLCYAKSIDYIDKLRIPLDKRDLEQYKLKDEHFEKLGAYKTKSFLRMRADDPRPGLQYNVKCPDGTLLFGEWKWEEKSFLKAYNENKIIIKKNSNNDWVVEYKLYEKNSDGTEKTKVPRSMILSEATNSKGKSLLTKTFGKANIFNNPKPIELLQHLIKIGTSSESDIVLDFFAGSGSTGHAVLDYNLNNNSQLKFICVQLPELTEKNSVPYKNGYKTISEITTDRFKKVINNQPKSQSNKLGFKYFQLTDSNFKQWRQLMSNNIKDLNEQMNLFVDPVSKNATIDNMVFELLLKSGKDLNSEVAFENKYYKININELILLLNDVNEDIIDSIIRIKPLKVIALDKLFKNNDQLKTNISLQLKDSDIEFKTI